MLYALADLLGMHSSLQAHYASQLGLPPPDVGDAHHALDSMLSAALKRAYAIRTERTCYIGPLVSTSMTHAREHLKHHLQ